MLSLLALGLALSFGAAHAADVSAECSAKSAEKKLAGAAKASFEKKCTADSGGGASVCDKTAAEKKLAGAAKTSFLKKCNADAKPAADAKPMAKPMADAKPAAKPMAKASDAKK